MFLFFLFVFIEFMLANRGDLDQTPCSRASDLGLHCLPMSLLWKWVKPKKQKKNNTQFILEMSIDS